MVVNMPSEGSCSTEMSSPEHNTTASTRTNSSNSSAPYSWPTSGLGGSQYFHSSPSDIFESTLDLNDNSIEYDFNSRQFSESAVQDFDNFSNMNGALSPTSDSHVSLLPSCQPELPLSDPADSLHLGAWIFGALQLSTSDPLHISRAAYRRRQSIPTTDPANLQVRYPFDGELDASYLGSRSNTSPSGILQVTSTNSTDRAMGYSPAASIIDPDVQNSTPETDRPRRFICTRASRHLHGDLCGRAFLHRRDLLRHERSVHSGAGCPRYRCMCGKLDTRKDNHQRHVGHCSGEYKNHYTCACGDQCVELDDHLLHVKQCRHGSGPPRGRR